MDLNFIINITLSRITQILKTKKTYKKNAICSC